MNIYLLISLVNLNAVFNNCSFVTLGNMFTTFNPPPPNQSKSPKMKGITAIYSMFMYLIINI